MLTTGLNSKLATAKGKKADVSSVSPSSERRGDICISIAELPQMSSKQLGKSFLQSILEECPYLSLGRAYFWVSTYHSIELNNCLHFIFTY